MTIPASIFLIATGAILKYAVTLHVTGINLQHAGVILMVAGAVGILAWLVIALPGARHRMQPPEVT